MRGLLFLLAAASLTLFAQEEPPLRVLFLGNSYTYYNDLPGMLNGLAAATPGRRLEAKAVTRGGANLSELWQLTPAVETLRNGTWDVVVLQEQSTLGQNYVDGRWGVNDPTGLLRWTKFWQTEISRKNAKTVLYLTWGRKAQPEFQTWLNYAYSEAAREIGAGVAPVGLAWKRLRESAPQIELFDPDGTHPSPVGTLLNACVFLDALLGRSCSLLPQSPAIVRLNENDWKQLVEAAQFAAEQYRAGALTNLVKPDYGNAKTLTANGAPAKPEDWNGSWRGIAHIYNGPHEMELQLTEEAKTCRGSVSLFNPRTKLRLSYPLVNCKIENAALSFFTADPRGLNEEYRVAWNDGKLSGTHQLRHNDPYIRFLGSFELRRHSDK